MHILQLAAIGVLVAFVLTHLLIKKDHMRVVWSEYALDPRYGWIMDVSLIFWGVATILSGILPQSFILNSGAQLKYRALLVISGISNLGGTFVKTTKDKKRRMQRLIHLFFAIIELTFLPIFIFANKKYVRNTYLSLLAKIHLFIFGILAVLFILEKLGKRPTKNKKSRIANLISSVLSVGFLEKVIILLLIVEGIML